MTELLESLVLHQQTVVENGVETKDSENVLIEGHDLVYLHLVFEKLLSNLKIDAEMNTHTLKLTVFSVAKYIKCTAE